MDPKKMDDGLVASRDVADPVAGGGNSAPVLAHGKPVEPPSYDWLGPSLRRIYDDVLNEPIPDSFAQLLKQLYERQKRR